MLVQINRVCLYNICINTGESDFRQISTNVTFSPGSSAGDQACVSVPIYSDGVLERSDETFQVAVSQLATQSRFVSVSFDRRSAISPSWIPTVSDSMEYWRVW